MNPPFVPQSAALNGPVNDFPKRATVISAGGARRAHESAIAAQIGIGIDLEDKDRLVALSHTQIDTSIIPQSDNSRHIERNAPDALRNLFIDCCRTTRRHDVGEG